MTKNDVKRLSAEELADIRWRHKAYDESRPRAPSDQDYMKAFSLHCQQGRLLATLELAEAEVSRLRKLLATAIGTIKGASEQSVSLHYYTVQELAKVACQLEAAALSPPGGTEE